ncbi:DNA polymerase Y family protein [Rhodococcus sp. HNM0569]|uniref:DNA polymerase Y family protein n=1 Tax=Rhodococcus sp. HNM0569 TaxID=2716340 RepID=UPI00146C8DA9|nr:DNA polymerase Y family protein [Rhodococcus sp. HNM0569]NLU81802.1 DNA polymerase Y family protein [Rhodococcus sp. HNM0569]
MTGARVMALWCPDWPAVAAAASVDLSPAHPVAVLAGSRVVACSAPARAEGVVRGLRKREAQARCPRLHVATADDDRDARLFETIVAAVDAVAPGVEVLRPGLIVLSARGVARYFGSEEVAAERLIDEVAAQGVECQVGVADHLTVAAVAARRGMLVAPGCSADFLAPLPMSELAAEPSLCAPDRGDLVDLLRRLGIRTVGSFAALASVDVATRFGPDAVRAHRVARGEDERPPSARRVPPDLDVELRCDPVIERVDAAAFAGRRLAERLHGVLSAAGVACTRLTVTAVTETGETHVRTWRLAEPLTPEGTADRVRWQLDGWLSGRGAPRPSSGVAMLRLEPVEVVAAGTLQLGLWGGVGEQEERARRALVRVQGILGGEAVQVGVLSGGRGPAERITLLPLGEERVPVTDPAQPWPGRLPEPAPASLPVGSPRIEVTGADGTPVTVSERGLFSDAPERVRWGSREWAVQAWSGPWTADEQWWDPAHARAIARAQVLLEDSRALLVRYTAGTWTVEGIYE